MNPNPLWKQNQKKRNKNKKPEDRKEKETKHDKTSFLERRFNEDEWKDIKAACKAEHNANEAKVSATFTKPAPLRRLCLLVQHQVNW